MFCREGVFPRKEISPSNQSPGYRWMVFHASLEQKVKSILDFYIYKFSLGRAIDSGRMSTVMYTFDWAKSKTFQ